MTRLLLYGICYSVILAVLLAAFLLIKKIFSKYLSPQGQYRIWLFLPVAAIAPFFPGDRGLFFSGLAQREGLSDLAPSISPSASAGLDTIRDLSVSVDRGMPLFLTLFLLTIWAAGVLFMAGRLFCQFQKSKKLLLSAASVKDPVSLAIFADCAKRLGIKRHIFLARSSLCRSPSSLGILHPTILLPKEGHNRQLKYILLHELAHHHFHDPFTNLLMSVFRAIFWFNPLLHLAAARLALDRELACDALVLDTLSSHEISLYGRAVLSYAEKNKPTTALGFSGETGLRKRILLIAAYRKESVARKRISLLLLGLFLCFSLLCVPPASALSGDTYRQGQALNISQEDLSTYFGDMDGSFVLYDKARDRYTVHNEKAARTRVSPNSTYKIYSGLSALESGIITGKQSARKWDGTDYPFREWNQDQSLSTAMQNSVNWYFQQLDRQAGTEKLQNFFDSIAYGNCNLSSGIANYWQESSLAISPLEQVLLLENLYDNQWDFDPQNILAIKNALHISGELSGKTGTGNVDGHLINGWFVGWLDSGTNTWFFAANIQSKDGASGSRAMEITTRILQDKGLLKE